MEKIHAGTSNNLNLNNDYASNNEELHHSKEGQQSQSPPVNRIFNRSKLVWTLTASNIMSFNLVNYVKK